MGKADCCGCIEPVRILIANCAPKLPLVDTSNGHLVVLTGTYNWSP
jgi:hypothetical protein